MNLRGILYVKKNGTTRSLKDNAATFKHLITCNVCNNKETGNGLRNGKGNRRQHLMVVKVDTAHTLHYVYTHRCETTSVLCASGPMCYIFVPLSVCLIFLLCVVKFCFNTNQDWDEMSNNLHLLSW